MRIIIFFLITGHMRDVVAEKIGFCEVSDFDKASRPIDFCKIPRYNEIGICKTIRECSDYESRRERYRLVHVCKYSSTGQISEICCSLNRTIAPGIRSQTRCKDYFTGITHFVVPNGSIDRAKAKRKEFPHMVAIGLGEKPDVEWAYGGTIIHSRFVITAVHCIQKDNRTAQWARLGDLILDTSTEAEELDVRVDNIYYHQGYKYPSYYHDIALLKLARFLSVSQFPYIQPACLHTSELLDSWKNRLQVVGWGATEYGGETSNHLLKANLTYVDYSKCNKRYQKTRRLADGIRSEYQICAGDQSRGDTCEGDSGGPLHYYNDNDTELNPHYVLVGITSFGQACGGKDTVGVYTKISHYLDWIEETIWPLCPTKKQPEVVPRMPEMNLPFPRPSRLMIYERHLRISSHSISTCETCFNTFV